MSNIKYSQERMALFHDTVNEQLGSIELAAQQLGVKPSTVERVLRHKRQMSKTFSDIVPPPPEGMIDAIIAEQPCMNLIYGSSIWHFNEAGEYVIKEDSRLEESGRPHLLFGDAHAPYAVSGTIDWLDSVHKRFNCHERVYCTGDLYDFHSMSRHTTELDSPSPDAEYKRAKEWVGELARVFPVATWVLGNHDQVPQRQLSTINVSTDLLKGYHELYNVPDTWVIEPLYAVLKDRGLDMLIEHGLGSGGCNGAINSAVAKGSSYAQGHMHAFAGVSYRASHADLKIGVNTGCLADNGSLAMRYGRYAKNKGVVGCTLVYPATNLTAAMAMFVPMNLGG